MEQITSSYNLFVDTSRSHTTGSKGDDFLINLQDAGVHASDGEHIRLNLENFSMAKTFTDVNATNNKIRVRGTSNGTVGSPTLYTTTGGDTFVDVTLQNLNYKNIFDLATGFSSKVRKALEDLQALGTVSLKANSIAPSSATVSTDNIIEFILEYTGTQLTSNADFYVQMYSTESDSYELLGGDRIEGNVSDSNLSKSINVSVNGSAPEITFTCRYPAQRSTMPFVYIRAPGVLNTNLETKGLKQFNDDHKSDVAHSDILGRVVVASQDYVQYTAQTGREFFLDIHQKQLSYLRLKLTDSRNRPIGRNAVSNTATGSGFEQSTLGNLNFSAVIRFDIVKSKNVAHLETQHDVPNVPARFSSGIVKQLRDGQDTFFKNPGLV